MKAHHYILIDEVGKILLQQSSEEELSTESNPFLFKTEKPVDLASNEFLYYFDFTFATVLKTDIPSGGKSFNYLTHEWEDNRSVYEVKNAKWIELKAIRDSIEFGGFLYKDNLYESDSAAQSRIMGATLSGLPQTWTTKDNLVVELTASDFKELYLAMQKHVSDIHERGRVARLKIEEATTVDEVDKIKL